MPQPVEPDRVIALAEGLTSALAEGSAPRTASAAPPAADPRLPALGRGVFFQFLTQAPDAIDEMMVLKCPELNPRRQRPSTESMDALKRWLQAMRPWLEKIEELRVEAIAAQARAAVAAGSLPSADQIQLTAEQEQHVADLARRLEKQRAARLQAEPAMAGRQRPPWDASVRARDQVVAKATGLTVGIWGSDGRRYLVDQDYFRPRAVRPLLDYAAESAFAALLAWSLDAGLLSGDEALSAAADLRAVLTGPKGR